MMSALPLMVEHLVCGWWTEDARWFDGHSAGCHRESLVTLLERFRPTAARAPQQTALLISHRLNEAPKPRLDPR